MQTASARVGMLQTLRNVFYKEGTVLEFQSYGKGFSHYTTVSLHPFCDKRPTQQSGSASTKN
jgi:hypothetical protein